MEVEIIPFEPCHFSAMAETERECFSTPFCEKDFSELYESHISNALVALVDNRVVGHISFSVIIDECQIINVAVTPSYRNMGIGSQIMREFLQHLSSTGVKKVFLEVRESNATAIKLYEKNGFFRVGVSKNHFNKPLENAILMNFEF